MDHIRVGDDPACLLPVCPAVLGYATLAIQGPRSNIGLYDVKASNVTYKQFDPRNKLRVFLLGLKYAATSDVSVTVQIALSAVVLGASFWLREWLHFMFILVVTGFMLVAELFNTAIEALCDYVQPDYDPRIGVVKDIAASAAGISILIWTLTLIFEVGRMGLMFFRQ